MKSSDAMRIFLGITLIAALILAIIFFYFGRKCLLDYKAKQDDIGILKDL